MLSSNRIFTVAQGDVFASFLTVPTSPRHRTSSSTQRSSKISSRISSGFCSTSTIRWTSFKNPPLSPSTPGELS
jgi:hypothetical protein